MTALLLTLGPLDLWAFGRWTLDLWTLDPWTSEPKVLDFWTMDIRTFGLWSFGFLGLGYSNKISERGVCLVVARTLLRVCAFVSSAHGVASGLF